MVTSCPDISKAAREPSTLPNSFPTFQYHLANPSLPLPIVENQLELCSSYQWQIDWRVGGEDEEQEGWKSLETVAFIRLQFRHPLDPLSVVTHYSQLHNTPRTIPGESPIY